MTTSPRALAVVPEPNLEPGSKPTIELVLRMGKKSHYKRTVNLAEKIAEMVADLRGRLLDEIRADEEARILQEQCVALQAEADRLEKQLAAAKARVKASKAHPRSTRGDSA